MWLVPFGDEQPARQLHQRATATHRWMPAQSSIPAPAASSVEGPRVRPALAPVLRRHAPALTLRLVLPLQHRQPGWEVVLVREAVPPGLAARLPGRPAVLLKPAGAQGSGHGRGGGVVGQRNKHPALRASVARTIAMQGGRAEQGLLTSGTPPRPAVQPPCGPASAQSTGCSCASG